MPRRRLAAPQYGTGVAAVKARRPGGRRLRTICAAYRSTCPNQCFSTVSAGLPWGV